MKGEVGMSDSVAACRLKTGSKPNWTIIWICHYDLIWWPCYTATSKFEHQTDQVNIGEDRFPPLTITIFLISIWFMWTPADLGMFHLMKRPGVVRFMQILTINQGRIIWTRRLLATVRRHYPQNTRLPISRYYLLPTVCFKSQTNVAIITYISNVGIFIDTP